MKMREIFEQNFGTQKKNCTTDLHSTFMTIAHYPVQLIRKIKKMDASQTPVRSYVQQLVGMLKAYITSCRHVATVDLKALSLSRWHKTSIILLRQTPDDFTFQKGSSRLEKVKHIQRYLEIIIQ